MRIWPDITLFSDVMVYLRGSRSSPTNWLRRNGPWKWPPKSRVCAMQRHKALQILDMLHIEIDERAMVEELSAAP